jgi:Domain of unknown function (DUF4167)
MRTGPYNNNNNNNKNRNRNRNRRPNTGGGGQAGGSGANRVYDSNGPDVKLRGTAQTIAEKYMQLARDANSSGDRVAAESYYQFGDHYYRVWLAAQPVGQPIQFTRRNAEDEFDDDGNEIVAETESAENETSETAEAGENTPLAEAGESQPEGEGYQPRQNNNRNNNYNNNNQNREGGNNRNFRQRWPRRNDRYNQDGQPNGNQADAQPEQGERQERSEQRPERFERPAEEPVVVQHAVESVDNSNWEAPSFLTRPVPVNAEAAVEGEAPPAPRRGRKPRVVAPVEDAPQGE